MKYIIFDSAGGTISVILGLIKWASYLPESEKFEQTCMRKVGWP